MRRLLNLKKSAMNIWASSESRAGGISAKAGRNERTKSIWFQVDDMKNIERHLAFRDYLRSHAREREAYAQLKRSLAQKFPYDIDGYCDGKDNFVKEMEAQALAQYCGIWDRLYLAARKVQNSRVISPFIEAGGVSAALVTKNAAGYTQAFVLTRPVPSVCARNGMPLPK